MLSVGFCENDDYNIAPRACWLPGVFETAVRFQDGFCAGEDCQATSIPLSKDSS